MWTSQDTNDDGDDNDASYNILEAHHNRNKPHKAPLFAPVGSDTDDADADADADTTDPKGEDAESDVDSITTDDQSEDESKGHTRAKRHSRTPYGSSTNPTQLQFYPLQWAKVLEQAKNKWRLYLLVTWAFPKRRKSDTTTALKECLTTAIADHEADSGLVEKGLEVIFF